MLTNNRLINIPLYVMVYY